MNVFISWSGDLSREIANVIRNWLPTVIQSVKPYFTPSDIDKGTKWETEISKKLSECRIGIICLTPENLESQWVMFEAGALSSKLDKSRVCTILFNLNNADVTGPLATFQTTEFIEEDVKKLLQLINKELGENRLEENVFDSVFNTFWPQLKEKIEAIIVEFQKSGTPKKSKRKDRDILEEILDLTRNIHRKQKLKTVSNEVDEDNVVYVKTKILNYLIDNAFTSDGISLDRIEIDNIVDELEKDANVRMIVGNRRHLQRLVEDEMSKRGIKK